MTVAIALAAGTVIGILLGLLGGGGSILAVPVLIFALGLDIDQAIPISLIVVGAASAVGAVPKIRAHLVQWRLAAVFAVAGIPATFLGTALGRLLPQAVVMTGFAIVMIVAGVRMLADHGDTGTACSLGDSGINWRHCAPRAIPAGLVVGVLTGLFGVGGGFLIIPALVLMLGIDMQIAIGTSLLVIVANSAAGLISHLGSGVTIDPAMTLAFSGAAVLASLFTGRLSSRIDAGRLQHWFAYLVFVIAVYVLFDTLFLSR
ncbi:sulfite exporter TauE/SafE family protein [Rhodococcus sp. KBS0724]|jgi:uncharacterized membrane protein YfcA|uniref:sulfite exporter TauE/SafE family protein n=1 Tax=Rhodococcus sp. KBS0724 TaxID=1179674 RepID=UPI00110EF11C|nr:sulfite exporter TauE/SafE family protein [Rhodococcus sp. KBS0724]TSD47541.1 sulfite exporter TauE/SafE family protein [Rhodococcus sp. KBS0724]